MNIFDLRDLLSRSLKIIVLALLLPVLVGLVQVFTGMMQAFRVGQLTVYGWFAWGFMGYVGMHLLLWRPEAVFRFSHRLFSLLAVWFFGGQVTSVESSTATRSRRRRSAAHELVSDATVAEGSPLVAFSPYVVPFYAVMVCVLGWFAFSLKPVFWVAGLITSGTGFALAMHWMMTADDLQEQRGEWYFETYLLAVAMIAILTLLVAVLALFWVLPEFSALEYLQAAKSRVAEMYTFGFKTLFVPE